MTRSSRAGGTKFAPAGAANNRDGSIGNAKHFPSGGRRITRTTIRSFIMNAVNVGSRDPVAAFGLARKESRKSVLLRFVEALKESRRREARRVIATHAHLLANRDTQDEDNQH